MDMRSLKCVLKFAKKGLPVYLIVSPMQPGKKKSDEYEKWVKELQGLENVAAAWNDYFEPFASGENLPDYFAREDQDTLTVFFQNPAFEELVYPVYAGQSWSDSVEKREVTLCWRDKKYFIDLEFAPASSCIVKIIQGEPALVMQTKDIYDPPKPEFYPREKQKKFF
jgi:hypothetical protein